MSASRSSVCQCLLCYRVLIFLARVFVPLITVNVAFGLYAPQSLQESREQVSETIKEKAPVMAALRPGESGIYRFRLFKNCSSSVEVSEFTHPVQITLMNARRERLIQSNSLDGEHGPRLL